ncbi:hypothetical protein H2201_006838 [Coniosporium apollinis]|uniref:Tyrosinase copper-binding domain-containing protein n=1 Tax=Coniosporium apollinis TaxID=61459 RepID=A0ABQ9NKX3_9PEZI|nr:hypothetical protein H2201_006838 [Coniosporium apollinis]
MPPPPRTRRSIRDLESDYNRGNTKPLEDLIRAWKVIQELPPDDPKPMKPSSFFTIAGYHREPFAAPAGDETDQITVERGVPPIFLAKTFTLNGQQIPNPLYFYTFQENIFDNLAPIPDADYSKAAGYTTVRYPFSGLMGTKADRVDGLLNNNVRSWLQFAIKLHTGKILYTGTREKHRACLDAPNYTIFSNTTSAMQWNEDHFSVKKWQEQGSPNPAPQAVVPLESPHNDMHLAIGGFELPNQADFNAIAGANGDMGENDTASFDPIFYFHHCFDVVNTESQLNYTYQPPATNDPLAPPTLPLLGGRPISDGQPKPTSAPVPTLRVSGINRGAIPGSFLVSVWATLEGNTTPQLVGVESVLS